MKTSASTLWTKTTALLAVLLTGAVLFAQSPESFSYQAVIRDANGDLVTAQTVGMQISILQGSATGTEVYVETHTPATNDNGLATVEIGNGTVVSGDFASIDWNNGPYFIKVETDPDGGTDYTISGTSQLLSVPYAMHAKEIDNIKTNTANASVEVNDDNFALLYITPTANTFNDSSGIYLGEGNGNYMYGIMMIYDGDANILRFKGKSTFDTANIMELTRDGFVRIINGLEVLEETSTPDINKVYGNSMPLAYGYVGGTTLYNNYGVVSVTNPSTGVYEVTLTNEWDGFRPVVVATSYNFTPDTEIITWKTSGSNKIIFNIVNESNVAQGSDFSFVVYGKPKH